MSTSSFCNLQVGQSLLEQSSLCLPTTKMCVRSKGLICLYPYRFYPILSPRLVILLQIFHLAALLFPLKLRFKKNLFPFRYKKNLDPYMKLSMTF